MLVLPLTHPALLTGFLWVLDCQASLSSRASAHTVPSSWGALHLAVALAPFWMYASHTSFRNAQELPEQFLELLRQGWAVYSYSSILDTRGR
jgi:hypothetical protein